MALAAEARVKVTNQSRNDRNKYGVVTVAAADDPNGLVQVRLDGQPAGQSTPFAESDLTTSDQAVPVTYS